MSDDKNRFGDDDDDEYEVVDTAMFLKAEALAKIIKDLRSTPAQLAAAHGQLLEMGLIPEAKA